MLLTLVAKIWFWYRGQLTIFWINRGTIVNAEPQKAFPELLPMDDLDDCPLVYSDFVLFNSGRKEIYKGESGCTAVLHLPQGSSWKRYNAKSKEDLEVGLKSDGGNDLTLSWDMLNVRDAIRIQAVTSTPGESIADLLEVKTRLPGVSVENIRNRFANLPSRWWIVRWFGKWVGISLILAVITIGFLSLTVDVGSAGRTYFVDDSTEPQKTYLAMLFFSDSVYVDSVWVADLMGDSMLVLPRSRVCEMQMKFDPRDLSRPMFYLFGFLYLGSMLGIGVVAIWKFRELLLLMRGRSILRSLKVLE